VAVMVRTLIPVTLPAALETVWLGMKSILVESAMIADRNAAANNPNLSGFSFA
jgi:hypothetical protein